MALHTLAPVKGRGSSLQTDNRFESVRRENDFEQLEQESDSFPAVNTEFLPDSSQSILSENKSPDIPFRYSINPYRGCEHGCSYCYARPGHEFLGMSAGLDFESRIMVKHDAASLLRKELNRPGWSGEMIALSGVTDCYQPAERRFQITRQLLQVMKEASQPVGVITKNALVARDLDLLAPMAVKNLAEVNISITTLDAALARTLEPRTSSPEARLRTMRELTAARIPVRVMVAPIIPGLNDHEIPSILGAARDAGAVSAGFTLLRLPLAVAPIFLSWLETHRPELRERVESRIRQTREGKLSEAAFGRRMRGEGNYAENIEQTFRLFKRKFGLDGVRPPLDRSQFRPPKFVGRQMQLF